jgi:2-(3-amino-3-carboxypropyl)histidine synthase
MKYFDFEEERIKQEVRRTAAKTVLLQLPEGLKPEGPRLARLIEETGATAIVSASPCYGGCDVAIDEALGLSVDLIVHFGHARFLKHENVPTLYIEVRAVLSVEEVVEKAVCLLKDFGRIGLATTVQHLQKLGQARECLIRSGKTVVIGDAGKLPYAGQVTGCDYSNVRSVAHEVDAFLYVGGGIFHPLGIALSTSKPTIIADPYEQRAFTIEADVKKVVKQRWNCVEAAKRAAVFGVIVGLKPGQKHFDEALRVKRALEKKGKTVCLVAAREILPEVLLEFPTIDAYVNTACPRIAFETASNFPKPILTVPESKVLIGDSSWENLLKEGFFGN